MKTIKIKERIKNARNAFLDNEHSEENNRLNYANKSIFLPDENFLNFTGQNKIWATILKQVFLFFPGTFLLFSATVALSFNYFIWQPQNYLKIFILIVGSLMMIGGIGDLKNPKHLVVPFSTIIVCALIFMISLRAGGQSFLMNGAIYFFPLMLIVPFLAKGWVDGKGED